MDTSGIGLAASIVSILVGVLAIVLSALFFVWTNASETRARVALSKVETLVSEMNSRTFGLLKDTWGDICRRAWPAAAENTNEPRLEQLRDELKQEIDTLSKALVLRDAKVDEIQHKLGGLVDTAINRASEAETDQARDSVLGTLRSHGGRLSAIALYREANIDNLDRFFRVLGDLRKHRMVTFKGHIGALLPDTVVRYIQKTSSEAAAASDTK